MKKGRDAIRTHEPDRHALTLTFAAGPHAAEPYHLFNAQTSNGLVGEVLWQSSAP